MPQQTRRSFLKTSTASGAAAFAAPLIAAQSGSASERLTVGVMGLNRGRAHCVTFGSKENVTLKYVCDVDSQRAGSAKEEVEAKTDQRPAPITDFRRILDDPEVDVLVVATPNHWHAPATILGCTAGKHVYVEKPASHNPREGEWMVEAARKYDRAVQLGTQRRSSESTRKAIQLLHEGVIGRVYHSRAWYNNLRGPIGVGKPADPPPYLDYELWQGPAPRVPYMDNRIHYNWHWFWHWGNGELGNNGVHSLDISRWGLDVDYPVRVTSIGGRYRFDDDQQTPDTHSVSFEFGDEKSITWQGLSCNKHKDLNGFVAFYGEEGAMELDGSGSFRIYDRSDKLIQEESGGYRDADHVQNLLTAIREGKHLDLNAEILEGHKSTLLCHVGNIAQRTGRTLNCSASDGHIIGDEAAMELWQREYEPGWEPVV